MMKTLLAAVLTLGLAVTPAMADDDDAPSKGRQKLPELVFGDGAENDFAVSIKEIEMKPGRETVLKVTAKGYKEYRLEAPEFYDAIEVYQAVVNDLEIHTRTLVALEFDDTGTIELEFTPKKPGTYTWVVKGLESKGMTGTFVIED
ncbi:MAG: hypothetical protein ACPGOV_06045 [Magnetovibrionaceae bacterium]